MVWIVSSKLSAYMTYVCNPVVFRRKTCFLFQQWCMLFVMCLVYRMICRSVAVRWRW